ncbi:MAG: 4-hydroxythreonine-4-phosphate dehydrogenase PdxA [Hyphomicrobiales bacterium]
MTETLKKPLALTIGEPAGIGPEIALRAWQTASKTGVPAFVLIGDFATMADEGARLDVPVEQIDCSSAAENCFSRALPVLDVPFAERAVAGKPASGTAGGVIKSIDRAVELTLSGETRAVVTNPIQKSALNSAGFQQPGHTEYLAQLSHQAGHNATPVMMLANGKLRAVPITVHMALADVPKKLTSELIAETARVTHADLSSRFGIAAPRLAFAGLNPHAGEAGMMGKEDAAVIEPAVNLLRSEGIDALGPLPADTMFHDEARENYDVAMCMYHDQALIPVKTLGFHDGVNVTLGLPFVRTSPDHGTALSLARTGKARPDSLIAALQLADRLSGAES